MSRRRSPDGEPWILRPHNVLIDVSAGRLCFPEEEEDYSTNSNRNRRRPSSRCCRWQKLLSTTIDSSVESSTSLASGRGQGTSILEAWKQVVPRTLSQKR